MIACIETIISYLAGAILAAFTAIILLEVLFRYWLHIALTWPSEASILLFQWMVFLAAPVALRQGLHFTVDVGVKALPRPAQKLLAVISAVIAFVVGILLALYSYRMARANFDTTYPTLPISAAAPNFGLMVSGALIALFSVQLVVEQLWNKAVER